MLPSVGFRVKVDVSETVDRLFKMLRRTSRGRMEADHFVGVFGTGNIVLDENNRKKIEVPAGRHRYYRTNVEPVRIAPKHLLRSSSDSSAGLNLLNLSFQGPQ